MGRTLGTWAPVAALALALRTSAGGAFLGLLHRRHRPARARAVLRADGTQEARVVVDHGYHPAHIELEVGIPAVLRFERRSDDACSELLVSELLPSSFRLASNAETAVRFTPAAPGTFAFTPTAVDMPKGGHHREGQLRFATITASAFGGARVIEFEITDVAVPVRTLRWERGS